MTSRREELFENHSLRTLKERLEQLHEYTRKADGRGQTPTEKLMALGQVIKRDIKAELERLEEAGTTLPLSRVKILVERDIILKGGYSVPREETLAALMRKLGLDW